MQYDHSDPTIGSVSLKSIAPPRSIGTFKKALLMLESFHPGCIFRVFPYTGEADAVQPLQDDLKLGTGPGLSPKNPIDVYLFGAKRTTTPPQLQHLAGPYC
jgi:hypothetical protein